MDPGKGTPVSYNVTAHRGGTSDNTVRVAVCVVDEGFRTELTATLTSKIPDTITDTLHNLVDNLLDEHRMTRGGQRPPREDTYRGPHRNNASAREALRDADTEGHPTS